MKVAPEPLPQSSDAQEKLIQKCREKMNEMLEQKLPKIDVLELEIEKN